MMAGSSPHFSCPAVNHPKVLRIGSNRRVSEQGQCEVMGDRSISLRDLEYRSILPSDFTSIKALHDDLFPVKYSNDFFQRACDGIGLQGGNLYTSIATDLSGAIIGFVLAQLFPYPQQCEDKDLFSFEAQPAKVCYIITLGVIQSARKSGLGSVLIQRCADHARRDAECGAVYLHVLSTNHAALSFYRRNEYLSLRYLQDFYYFDSAYHSAYLYVLYLNGYKPPMRSQLWQTTSQLLESGAELLQTLLSYLPAPRALVNAAGFFGTLSIAPALLLRQAADRGDGCGDGVGGSSSGGMKAASGVPVPSLSQVQGWGLDGSSRGGEGSEGTTTAPDETESGSPTLPV